MNKYKQLTSQELWDFITNNRYPIALRYLKDVAKAMGNPQDQFKTIHVAGSNGKGSTTNALKDVLIQHGMKVGMFTSPHIIHPRERMRINNVPITDEEFRDIAIEVLENVDNIVKYINTPHYGGVYSLIAYKWFAKQNVDIAVIEVGVGGRYDQTNTITPLVSIVTNVDIDHVDSLGTTYHEIAFHKGGIIKENVPCVLGSSIESVVKTISLISDESHAPLYRKDVDFKYLLKETNERSQIFDFISAEGTKESIEIGLSGEYQCENMSVVLKTIEILNTVYGFDIKEETYRTALKNSMWEGRFEYLNDNTIVDGAHNIDGMIELVKTLKTKYPNEKLTFLYSNIATKDYAGMMEYLEEQYKEHIHHMVITEVPNSKRLDAEIIYELCPFEHKSMEKSILNGYERAKEIADRDNTKLIICGSLYLMGKIKEHIKNNEIIL